jgi:hypothetical protein
MKKLPKIVAALMISMPAFAQTTLFFEDFETGGSTFNLNTADLGGLSATSGPNQWIVNGAYTGGVGTELCDFSDQVAADVPAQPAGITSANGNYLHIYSDAGEDWLGTLNCNFMPGSTSCSGTQSYFAEMSSDVSTTGMGDVELSFWWLCEGSGYGFGEVYYSINGGMSWIQITTPIDNYAAQLTWTEQTLTMAAFDDQPTLRFAFRFENNLDFSGYLNKMAFGIDDVEIVATPGSGCSDSFSSFAVDACFEYTVPSGDETYSTSGVVMDTIPNAEGCDSIMTIDVVVTTFDMTLNTVDNVISVAETGPGISYQWYNCDSGFALIPGETMFNFVATIPGNYAVVVSDGVCADTSECTFAAPANILSNSFENRIQIYPNPVQENFSIYLGANYKTVTVSIMSLSGETLSCVEFDSATEIVSLSSPLSSGFYFLEITTDTGERARLKFIKE